MMNDYFINIDSLRLQELDKNPLPRNTVVVITSNLLGTGDESLGKALMKGYLHNLRALKTPPKSVIFINKGVLLTASDSVVLDILKVLSEQGVEIISSSTCLDFYKIKNTLAIGQVAAMKDIVEKIHSGENTIVL